VARTSKRRRGEGLAGLLHPLPPARFLDHHWTRRITVARGAPGRMPQLFGAAALQSLAGLLACPHERAQAWVTTRAGGHVQFKVGAAEAEALFAQGATTIVVDFLRHPVVDELLLQLHRELGTPQHEVFCSAYVSPPGIGTVMHFDSQDIFLVQIKGRKRWRVAPVAELKHPSRSFVPAVGRVEPDLAPVAARLPREMPKTARTVNLSPGAVLYMPKGTWHASQTVEASIALTLTFPSMSWMDLALAHLRRRLVQREEWRAPALGVIARGQAQLDGLARLQELLEALGGELGALI
jgi:ribosomal protein L16 Arg81 hydroxylase